MDKTKVYSIVLNIVRKVGIDFSRFPRRNDKRIIRYLEKNHVTDCFDIGAHAGEYGHYFRSIGFKGQIHSFEPQKEPFLRLTKKIKNDKLWNATNIGLGDKNGNSVINISKNLVSSSLLEIHDTHTDAAPDSKYIDKEDIQVKRLDTYISEINFKKHFFLKIDAQGFEDKILQGADGCFSQIAALQLEMACVPLYKGEKLFDEMKQFIESKGFYLSSVENGLTDDNNGKLLQIEAVFFRQQ